MCVDLFLNDTSIKVIHSNSLQNGHSKPKASEEETEHMFKSTQSIELFFTDQI